MDIGSIPVRVIGPRSQPEEHDGQVLSYIDMPSEMWSYRPPELPEPDAVQNLAAARDAMQWLQQALARYPHCAAPQLANLTALDDDNRGLVNQILGEGEVAISFNGELRARTQEAVLAGVWRTLYLDDADRIIADILEVADAPHVVRMAAAGKREIVARPGDDSADLMNALSLLVELRSHVQDYELSGKPHVINLTLLPLSDADLVFLDEQLGRGPVDTLSRAYGKCQVISTQVPNVWWVRFYNSMNTLILNTLEVIDVPAVICAAPEDLQDSAQRLAGLLTPYWPDTNATRYECRICWYLYDPAAGDPLEQIPAGTEFRDLPEHWRCPQCDAGQFAFLPAGA
ncbi:MAG: rubredoxin [Gammaproteobacteria bacterium]|nr:rubredoxin [Gammaproteobacteria bacterium]MDH5303294.1 rubredoxin [Gammaproteobacteria bacterium]MDH5321623.1 rubredoxin [Gammaproteobacteria bacterium]